MNKKSVIKVGVLSLSIFFIFLFVIFLLMPFLSSSSLEKNKFLINEKIKINLKDYPVYTVKIVTPTTSFIKKGSSNVLMFVPKEIGTYKIQIESNGKKETLNFEVFNSTSLMQINDSSGSTYNTIENSLNVFLDNKNESFGEIINSIEIGKPVRWVKKISIVPGTKRSVIILPINKNLSVYKKLPNSKEIITNYGLENENNNRVSLIFNNLSGDFEIEYYTDAPVIREEKNGRFGKKVFVSSSLELNYTNVSTFTDIDEFLKISDKDKIKVFWEEEDKYLDFNALDTNGNGLIDRIEWIVPHLSNQTFDVIIKVLNVQSYPVVGGNWEVRFETLGKANLTIKAIDGTTWSNSEENLMLKFLEIKCGNSILNYEWKDGGVFIRDFECNDTGIEISKVLQPGKHILEFDFGDSVDFAFNEAILPINGIQVRAANPDPVDRSGSGKYAIIVFNPTNSPITVTNVWINATSATSAVWSNTLPGGSYPATGWTASGNRLVIWTGTMVIPAREIIGFYVTVSSNNKGLANFPINYYANISGTLYKDPHTHVATEDNAVLPFAQLALDINGGFPYYNQTVDESSVVVFNVSFQETANSQIVSNSKMMIDIPSDFTNIRSMGGTGWSSATINGNIITVNSSSPVQNSRINYAFNATVPSAYNGSKLYAVNYNLSGTNARAVLEAGIKVKDISSPEISSYSPLNNNNYTTNSIFFNISLNENGSVCYYNINSSGYVLMSSVNSIYFNATNLSISDGYYIVTYSCNDSEGNLNNTFSINFKKDSNSPLLNIVYPLNQTYTTNVSQLNYTYYDLNPGLCWYSNGTVNSTTYSAGTNFTNIYSNQGWNNWTLWCNDTVNNLNSSQVRFFKDTIIPLVSVVYPLNQTYTTNVSQLNYTYSDSNPGLCWYSNRTVNSTTYATGTNFSNIYSNEGMNNWTVYCNDTANNLNNSFVSFFKDTISPTISFESQTLVNYSNVSQSFVFANVSIIEANEANVSFRLSNSSHVVNWSNYSAGTRQINWTLLSDGLYYYNVTVTDLINQKNFTETRWIRLDTTIPFINFTVPTLENNSNVSWNWVFVNISVSELNEANVSFRLSNSSHVVNWSNYSAGTRQINWTGLSDGLYFYNVTVADIMNNRNSTETRIIRTDTEYPLISFEPQTLANNSNMSQNFVFANVLIVEANEANVSFRLSNSSHVVNWSNYSAGTRQINWTGLLNGVYYYNISVFDVIGRFNVTETRKIFLDTEIPAINNFSDSPDPLMKNSNITFFANVTDNFNVSYVWVNIEGNIYYLNLFSKDIYNLTVNTSILSYDVHDYIIYANDSVGNNALNYSGTFRVVQEFNVPVIYNISHRPEPVNFNSVLNITANVSDDTSVNQVWVSVNGINYSMSNAGGELYFNNSIDTSMGIGIYDYIVYANDTSDNLAASQSGSFSITEGLGIFSISVRAANPDPSAGKSGSGKYGVIIFNPYNTSINITNVFINASEATNTVFGSITQGAGSSVPTTGWTLVNNRLISWSSTSTILAPRNAIGFWITVTPSRFTETFRTRYAAVLNGTYYEDPHNHQVSVDFSAQPFAQLAFDDSGYPKYNISVNQSVIRKYNISLEESAGSNIPSGVRLTVQLPDGFTNIINNSATGFGGAIISGQYIYVNTTQLLNGGRMTFSFNATAPDTPGLYIIRTSMDGTNARAVLEGAIRIVDVSAPQVTLVYPTNNINFSSLLAPFFNYTVSDWGSVVNCSLYGNFNGSFISNQSVTYPQQEILNNFSSVILNDGFYLWNVKCFDEFGNNGFTTANFTFGAFLFPYIPTNLNISQMWKNGSGNVTLTWDAATHAINYYIYYSDDLKNGFSLMNNSIFSNYTDIGFNSSRRFYKVSATNPLGENLSDVILGRAVYLLKNSSTNSRNWAGFYMNSTILKDANTTLRDIPNASAFTMWNETIQKRVTCNTYSCPGSYECTSTNCNFNFTNERGRGYEININNSVNWSVVGKINNKVTVNLVKNLTSFGKNWISMGVDTTLSNGRNLIGNISKADAVTRWDPVLQSSKGYIIPWGIYVGENFNITQEEGYEVSVTETMSWEQK